MTIFVIILSLINFLIRIPFFNLPLHHDELVLFDGALKIYQNHLNPFIDFSGYHPPVFFEPVAILFRIFGPSRVWGRLIVDIFSSLSLIFTYLLGKKIFSARTGFLAALLLFFFPLFMGQSFLYQPPVLLTFLTLITLYCYFSDKKIFYLIFATLLVLTHETTIFVIILLSLFNYLRDTRKNKLELLRESCFFLSPLIFFFLWTLLNRLYLGWFFWPEHFSLLTSNRAYPQKPFDLILNLAVRDNLFWVIFIAIFLGLIFTHRKEVFFFVFLYFFYLIIFYKLDFLPRYLLFLTPLVFLSFVWSLEKFLLKGRVLLISFIVGLFLFIFSYINFYYLFLSPEQVIWVGERDLSFLRIVFLQKEAADYINSNFSDDVIISKWPIDQAFQDPFYGYVKKRMITWSCGTDEEKDEIKRWLSQNNSKNIILVSSTAYWVDRCLNSFNFRLVKEIDLDYFPKADNIQIFSLVYDK